LKDKLSAKKKVLLVGPFPPPYGGVSVHILRFKNLLKEEFAFDFIDESPEKKNEIFNIRSLNIFRYLQKIGNADVVYIHSGSNLLRIYHLFVGRLLGKKIILVLHGFTSSPPKFVFYVKGLIYRLATTITVVNEDIKKRLYLPEKKCVTKEAFIPPLLKDEPPLPESIANLVCKSKDGGKVVICANAFRLEKYKDQDLYGLDMCIEVAKRLLTKDHSFIFIYIVSSIDDKADDYNKAQQLIRDLHLSNHFFLTNEKLSFVKLMQDSDIIVRPTNTDGDSLTIREGLFLNKKVLASDVVERPKGVVLFQSRNFDDLEMKLADLIRSKNIHAENTSQENSNKQNENFKKYYCDLINSL
jgi:glycosyltransferase involved in cell wall biosynthesis